jgi:hypothetical protein
MTSSLLHSVPSCLHGTSERLARQRRLHRRRLRTHPHPFTFSWIVSVTQRHAVDRRQFEADLHSGAGRPVLLEARWLAGEVLVRQHQAAAEAHRAGGGARHTDEVDSYPLLTVRGLVAGGLGAPRPVRPFLEPTAAAVVTHMHSPQDPANWVAIADLSPHMSVGPSMARISVARHNRMAVRTAAQAYGRAVGSESGFCPGGASRPCHQRYGRAVMTGIGMVVWFDV